MTRLELKWLAPLCMAAALAGCGGSSGGDTSGEQGVPQSAQQSVAGLLTFLEDLIARTSETAEPISLGDVVLPTSETL